MPHAQEVHVGASQCMARDPVTGWFTVPLQLGLFASRPFALDDPLATFRGEIVSHEVARQRTDQGFGGYQIHLSRELVLDCFQSSRSLTCLASFANSAHNLWDMALNKKARNNARLRISYTQSGGWTARLNARSSIKQGQEILFPFRARYRSL